MPDWRGQLDGIRFLPRNSVNGKAAKALFSLWKDESNKLAKNVLKRPTHISLDDVNAMQQDEFHDGSVAVKHRNHDFRSPIPWMHDVLPCGMR